MAIVTGDPMSMTEEGRENGWPAADPVRSFKPQLLCSSFKPPLPLRPALIDVDSNSEAFERIPRESVPTASGSKKLCIEVAARYFSAMYCVQKKNAKHNGPWFDGVLTLHGSKYNLQNLEGKIISKGSLSGSKEIEKESVLEVGRFKIEVMDKVSPEDYNSGQIFSTSAPFTVSSDDSGISGIDNVPSFVESPARKFSSGQRISMGQDQLVLNRVEAEDGAVPVIVDPYIASKLRPHQRDGVKFMYECVMGIRCPSFTGCLLADEMGLGKTIQVISLVWTLIQQGPKGVPVLKRAIVVCPSSLVQNWGKEVRKWLGAERLKALVVDAGLSSKEATQKFLDFKNDKFCPLLITSYETLRKYKDLIASAKPGLLICDEAHRLKNCTGNKTINSLLSLSCPRRILLTGTPVQNNLNEFYALIDFANPNILGPLDAFKRLYACPIERSQDRNAREFEKELGRCRSEELQRKTNFCILRRTADINMKYLPSKTEYVVFCKLQAVQIILYEMFIKSKFVRTLLVSDIPSAHVLSAIGALRKLCNHPGLVQTDMKYITSGEIKNHPRFDAAKDVLDFLANNQVSLRGGVEKSWSLSGKFVCLSQLLSAAIESDDRVVVVSNFTQTLDMIQLVCDENRWKWLRLDGATEISGRQALVDRFNRRIGDESVFLLSSKAGGTGLNLIGASRLVLVDPDWNPAIDSQAMARVWREGQQKPVVIYRLLSTGSIEEKIYQRQIMKTEITSSVGGQSKFQLSCKSSGQNFSKDELRELFTLHSETNCHTYDILSRANPLLGDGFKDSSADLDDHVLRKVVESGIITFVSTDSATATGATET